MSQVSCANRQRLTVPCISLDKSAIFSRHLGRDVFVSLHTHEAYQVRHGIYNLNIIARNALAHKPLLCLWLASLSARRCAGISARTGFFMDSVLRSPWPTRPNEGYGSACLHLHLDMVRQTCLEVVAHVLRSIFREQPYHTSSHGMHIMSWCIVDPPNSLRRLA